MLWWNHCEGNRWMNIIQWMHIIQTARKQKTKKCKFDIPIPCIFKKLHVNWKFENVCNLYRVQCKVSEGVNKECLHNTSTFLKKANVYWLSIADKKLHVHVIILYTMYITEFPRYISRESFKQQCPIVWVQSCTIYKFWYDIIRSLIIYWPIVIWCIQ